MKAVADESVQRLTQSADLVTPDGIGIVWAARRKGVHIAERVTGVELVEELLAVAGDRHQSLRVYILGATEASCGRCIASLRDRYPMHVFAGRNGYFQQDDWPAIEEEIRSFNPDLWLVGLASLVKNG